MSMMPPASNDKTTTPRKAIPRRLRFEILRRDNYTCRYCHATDTALTIDHVTPAALGGSDDPSNLVTACKDCNAGKSSSSPDAATVAQVSDDAVRWAEAMKLAADRLTANKAAVAEQLRPWFDDWILWSGPGWSYKLPDDADRTLEGYLAAGMPLDVLRDAARIACSRRGIDDRFRYFLGVANNMLHELQRDASALMSAQENRGETASDQDSSLGWHNRPWRKGYLKALEHIRRAESGDPIYRETTVASAFQYGALAVVVDAGALDRAAG